MRFNFAGFFGCAFFALASNSCVVSASPKQSPTIATVKAEADALENESFLKPTMSRYFGTTSNNSSTTRWREWIQKDKNTWPIPKSTQRTAIVSVRSEKVIMVSLLDNRAHAQPTGVLCVFRSNGLLIRQTTFFLRIKTPKRTFFTVFETRYYDSAGHLAYSKTTYEEEKPSHSTGARRLRKPLPNDALSYVRKHVVVYKHASDLPFYHLLKKPKP